MIRRFPFAAALAVALSLIVVNNAAVRADGPLKLEWANLIPVAKPIGNPVDELRPDQLQAFYAAEYYRTYYAGSKPLDKALIEDREGARKDAEKAERKLAKQGVDVDALFKRYTDYQKEVDRRGRATMTEYDGRQIALAGYLLPLDFNEAGVREFLLVPFVGACIHVPPPPPNQVVFVKSTKPYKLSEIYDSVRVTGQMKVGPVTKNLSLMDGANNVDAGYTLLGDRIEPYKYEESAPQQ